MSFFEFIKFFVGCMRHPKRLFYPNSYNNKRFIEYLRKRGAKIGRNTRFISPSNCVVDPGRVDYITIGDNCCLSNVSILAHDYSWYVFLDAYNDIVPDPGGEVVIGNNVFVGYQTVILKDTHIGDNVIIGARSVVKGDVPSNSVWAGCPAKMICSLDEFYNRKKNVMIESAIKRCNHIQMKYGREPTIHEMGLFAFLFLDRNEHTYSQYIQNIELNGIKRNKRIKELFFSTKPLFPSFDAFLNSKKK